MRCCDWLGSNWIRCRITAAAVAFWCSGMVIPLFAQDSGSKTESLPNAPSAVRQYTSSSKSAERSLTFGKRARIYSHEVFGPETIVGPAFGAGIGQWEDEPPGWNEGGAGYGKRFGSGVARHTIAQTIRFGFAAADGEDPRYFPSDDKGFWGRTRHAIVSIFVSQTSSGSRIPAFSRFAGTYGAAFISKEWYPANRATAEYAARRGSTALASSVGFHLLREFVPQFRHAPK